MKKLFSLLTFATICATTAVTYAGYKAVGDVSVGSGQAVGCMGGARNSADNVQYMICRVGGNVYGNKWASCLAQDANGNSASCYTTAIGLVERVSTVRSDSLILFNWDGNGNCTNIYVENNSYCEPRK